MMKYPLVFVKNYLNDYAWELKLKEVLFNNTKNQIVCKNALKLSEFFTTKKRAMKILSIFKN